MCFRSVPNTGLAKRMEAFFRVLLHSADMQTVLMELGARELPPRFNPRKAMSRLPGETEAEHEEWLLIFENLHLASLPGYPAWEQNVYSSLH
eukprot:896354-Prymnesium_polylepis.1